MYIVTGANGFIGSALIWQLNAKKRGPVVGVDSVTPQERPQPLRKRELQTFLHKDELWAFLKTNAPTIQWIIHMGACSSTTETNIAFLRENNTEYTERLFAWCRDHNVPFIYASSGAVYGDGKKGFSDQVSSHHYLPLNPYGESKAAFDRWLEQQTQFPPHWYGLRFFNVYGPGEEHKDAMASVVFKAFQQIQQNRKLKLFRSHRADYRDGHQNRDFVYVKDVVRWICELLDGRVKSGIYNMGYGSPRTWLDLANATFGAMKKEVLIEWIDVPENIRNQYQYTTCADMQKWQGAKLSPPQWGLEQGIEDYVQFLTRGEHYL